MNEPQVDNTKRDIGHMEGFTNRLDSLLEYLRRNNHKLMNICDALYGATPQPVDSSETSEPCGLIDQHVNKLSDVEYAIEVNLEYIQRLEAMQ